jgi:chemotaxis protein CheX
MTSIHPSVISEAVIQATCEVFSTMLAQELEPGPITISKEPMNPAHGVVALVGLAGEKWVGAGSICCSTELSCKVAGTFMMTEYAAVNDEVLDALGELTNMIIGNVKNELENEIGLLGMSIPTVVFGRNFTTHSSNTSEWHIVTFLMGEERLDVKICLAPQSARHATRADADQLGMVV